MNANYALVAGGWVATTTINIMIFAASLDTAIDQAKDTTATLSKAGYFNFWLWANKTPGEPLVTLADVTATKLVGTLSVKTPDPVATFTAGASR